MYVCTVYVVHEYNAKMYSIYFHSDLFRVFVGLEWKHIVYKSFGTGKVRFQIYMSLNDF